MSKQFEVFAIYALLEATPSVPKYTVFAVGKDGLYRYNLAVDPTDAYLSKGIWPRADKKKETVTLWRDHWSYFCDHSSRDHGPYFLEVLDAPKFDVLKQQRIEIKPGETAL